MDSAIRVIVFPHFLTFSNHRWPILYWMVEWTDRERESLVSQFQLILTRLPPSSFQVGPEAIGKMPNKHLLALYWFWMRGVKLELLLLPFLPGWVIDTAPKRARLWPHQPLFGCEWARQHRKLKYLEGKINIGRNLSAFYHLLDNIWPRGSDRPSSYVFGGAEEANKLINTRDHLPKESLSWWCYSLSKAKRKKESRKSQGQKFLAWVWDQNIETWAKLPWSKSMQRVKIYCHFGKKTFFFEFLFEKLFFCCFERDLRSYTDTYRYVQMWYAEWSAWWGRTNDPQCSASLNFELGSNIETLTLSQFMEQLLQNHLFPKVFAFSNVSLSLSLLFFGKWIQIRFTIFFPQVPTEIWYQLKSSTLFAQSSISIVGVHRYMYIKCTVHVPQIDFVCKILRRWLIKTTGKKLWRMRTRTVGSVFKGQISYILVQAVCSKIEWYSAQMSGLFGWAAKGDDDKVAFGSFVTSSCFSTEKKEMF